MRSPLPRVLFSCLILLTSASVATQEKPPAEPVPAPGAEVKRLLDDSAALAGAGQFDKSLAEADKALASAQQSTDTIGLAMAQRSRATALVRLGRADDALAAWRSAEDAWRQAGDGPGQIQAIAGQVVHFSQPDKPQALALLTRAIEIGRSEKSRPRAALAAVFNAGAQLVQRLPDGAQRAFEAVRSIEEASGTETLELAAALNALGSLAGNRGDRAAERSYKERALAIREKLSPNSTAVLDSLNGLALNALSDRQPGRAREYYQRALTVGEKITPTPAALGSTLTGLGDLSDDLDARLGFFQRALAVREKALPGSAVVADSLHDIGQVSAARGDLAGAGQYYERSVALYEQTEPNSLNFSRVLNSLGVLNRRLGNLDAALAYFQRALRIREELTPNTSGVATILNNLGYAAREKGDLKAAREYLERSLAIVQGTSAMQFASALNNMGLVAKAQGDQTAAREYFERAIDIEQRAADDSDIVANYISNLGNVLAEDGDFAAARTQHLRVLAIRTRIAEKSNDVAVSLNNLAALEVRTGNVAAARDYASRAVKMWTEMAPRSLALAECLQTLGGIALAEGDVAAARSHLLQALAIQELRAPTALPTVETLQALAGVAQAAKETAAAVDYATRAWALVRSQAALVSGDEARQAFAAAYQSFATETVRIQIAAGQTDAAFATLEESRAQSLLQAIAGRGVVRRLAAPETLQRYDLAQAAANRAGTALERAGAAEADARAVLDVEEQQLSGPAVVEEKRRLVRLAQEKRSEAETTYTRARVEAESRWAETMRSIDTAIPTPIALADARRALPPNTLLASFAVGEESSLLFLVSDSGRVETFAISLRAAQLEARTRVLRRTIARDQDERGLTAVMPEAQRIQSSRDLFQALFPPAARQAIARAGRLVLSPDGVLWDLPFAALVTNADGRPTYLGLEKPLSYTQSLTALAQSARRPSAPTAELIIVGNPLYENAVAAGQKTASRAGGERASMSAEGDVPPPLPFAEQEAREIASLYKTRASIGAEPTEAWFRARAGRARVIHLATHGYFNPSRAVSSGVWLAVPGTSPKATDTNDDGALQAWEVLTDLRLQADLVILSACETGVGAKIPGEGLIGLTRAFQVAGAASVVATQWKVADRSTSQAMVEFHRRLLSGQTRGDALFEALKTVAAERATEHPYHWAPFVLVGDFGLGR